MQRPASTPSSLLSAGLSFGFAAVILYYFHDRFWWAPDDGAYGYAAQRMLAGDVQNGNLQELHPGYIGFLHVLAFRLFGEDLLSLRYPLVAVSLAQVVAGWWLLRPHGPVYAAVGAAMLTALSCIQFLNPSPNWYALAMAFAVVVLLSRAGTGGPGRDILIGALLVATFMMRQLSGVLLAMGAVTWLLTEARTGPQGPPRLARIIVTVMALGLVAYLWRNGSLGGALLFGLWALALLAIAFIRATLGDAATLRLAGRLTLGGILIALPLIAYHAWHGTFATLYGDTVLAVLHLTELGYQAERRHWILGWLALGAVLAPPDAASVASGLFWLALLATPPVLGLWLAVTSRRRAAPLWRPLTVVAVFFALVATPFEIPIYLTYGSGLSLLALMWIAGHARAARLGFGIAALLVAAVGIGLHAAEPLTRGMRGIAEGRRVPLDAVATLPRATLRIEAAERQVYARLLALIDRHAAPGARILALPANPELYFMSGRPSPYRFYIAATGIRDAAALEAAVAVFQRAPPPVVIHDPSDKFNSWASDGLMAKVKDGYVLAETIGRFDVYLPK